MGREEERETTQKGIRKNGGEKEGEERVLEGEEEEGGPVRAVQCVHPPGISPASKLTYILG